MKRTDRLPRSLHLAASAFALVLASASHAFANNAPGPLAVDSILSLVILIVVLTFAGGGYTVSKRLDDAKYTSKVKRTIINTLEFLAGVVLFFVGLMATIFGVVGFALYAVGRGVKMLRWARAAEMEGPRPPYLEEASPWRLRTAGLSLIILTVLVVGYSVLHIDDVTGAGDYKKRARVAQLTAEVKNAMAAAEVFFADNPKARRVTCEDLVKAGLVTQHKEITCFSDLTPTSGSIRMTGPASWKLTNPVAAMTYDGQFTPAER